MQDEASSPHGASTPHDDAARPEDGAARQDPPTRARGMSRRAMLGAIGAGTLGLAGAALGGLELGRTRAGTPTPAASIHAFVGEHQAGIVTPAQDRLYAAAFDLTTSSRDDLVTLLRTWTTMTARLTRGLPAGPSGPAGGPYDAPPDDTGEAADLHPAGLTLTFGLGRSLFVGTPSADGRPGTDRFGLADRLPGALAPLPHFPGDALDPDRSDGDLIVQACSDDPQLAVHAVRNLSRAAFGLARIRWTQLGYGRTSSTSTTQATPRNLFGFKDGTANLKAEEPAELTRHLWVQPEDARADAAARPATDSGWMTGGTYLVARRIRMQIETWDRSSLREQEAVVGRTKMEGAPLSGGTERTEVDLVATGRDGAALVPADSHVRLAHPTTNGGVRMLRRGYTFTDGNDALGRLDAGLFFMAFVRDPRTQYVPMQSRLAAEDALAEYLVHTGSGVFAVPPGVPRVSDDGSLVDGAFLGATLLG